MIGAKVLIREVPVPATAQLVIQAANNARDAAQASANAAATSETNASNSANAAATSETNASNSADAAANSETNASNSANAAATSETNASNSANAAATSETNASNSAASIRIDSETFASIPPLVNACFVLVASDETNGNLPTLYFYNGANLNWIPSIQV